MVSFASPNPSFRYLCSRHSAVSLPSMINENECDTQLPSNLFDEEFGPDTKMLPASRPRVSPPSLEISYYTEEYFQSEPTPISYMITKVKLCLELGNILQVGQLAPSCGGKSDLLSARLDLASAMNLSGSPKWSMGEVIKPACFNLPADMCSRRPRIESPSRHTTMKSCVSTRDCWRSMPNCPTI